MERYVTIPGTDSLLFRVRELIFYAVPAPLVDPFTPQVREITAVDCR